MKDGLIAKKCLFEGDNGYMVKQMRNGNVVVEQFVREDEYEQYCREIGVRPVIEN